LHNYSLNLPSVIIICFLIIIGPIIIILFTIMVLGSGGFVWLYEAKAVNSSRINTGGQHKK